MILWILRAVFLLVAAGVGVTLARGDKLDSDPLHGLDPFFVFCAVMLLAAVVIAVDIVTRHKRIDVISSIYFGVIVGTLLTYLFNLALEPLFPNITEDQAHPVRQVIALVLGISLCYVCTSVLLQTKDDFRFIIPYVEFAKEVKGHKPYVLDTSVIIDGRIADVVETGALDSQLIMPRFVLAELQGIADSSDKLRRSRGRRGLDILNRLRNYDGVDFKIYERDLPELDGQPVDMKLVLLAKHLDGKIVTGDYNLNKVAKLHNVPVINLNDIANSLKPTFLPGETLDVRIVKAGEEPRQGVGYLDDGTMIVVEGGRAHIGETVNVTVTSVLQTSAGRMIFGRYETEEVK